MQFHGHRGPCPVVDCLARLRSVLFQAMHRLGDYRVIVSELPGVMLPAGSTCSDPSPVLRSYTSFSQAATENAYSRILIGFHFRKSIEEGTAYGRKIGERAVNLYLRPVR